MLKVWWLTNKNQNSNPGRWASEDYVLTPYCGAAPPRGLCGRSPNCGGVTVWAQAHRPSGAWEYRLRQLAFGVKFLWTCVFYFKNFCMCFAFYFIMCTFNVK